MPVVLSVAEKPSVAKGIASVLGGPSPPSRQGRSRYNRIYELPDVEVGAGVGRSRMLVTSVAGHLKEIDFEAPYE